MQPISLFGHLPMMETIKPGLEDFKINVRIKLSALWTVLMFCYVYGDFFILFVPGHIQSMMSGNSGVGKTTPVTILLFAVLLSIPAIMIFLSLILRPKTSRLLNISMGVFFTVIMLLTVASSVEKWMMFYIYLGIVEIMITLLITSIAWRWPK